MSNGYGQDLTSGSILKTLIKLGIPIFLTYLLVSSYSIVNSLWIGNILGEYGLAAVAVNFPISMFLTVFFNSMGTSVAILISHNFGAKNNDGIQKVVNTAFPLILIISAIVAIGGSLGTNFIIKAFNVPVEIRGITSTYLILTFVSYLFFGLYNLTLSIFRSVGNVKLPLFVTLIGVIVNAIIDPLLIVGVGPFPKLGLNGAAIATMVCNAVILFTALIYLKVKYANSPIYPKKFSLNKMIVKNILKIGLPSFFQQTLIYIGTGIMTIFVNGFGIKEAAAYGTVGRIDAFAILPAGAVLFAVMTVTAQHIGSKKLDKIKDIFKWGLVVNTPVILTISLLVVIIPELVMHAFVKDAAIIRLGAYYFRLAGIGYLFYIPNFVANGIVTAAKKPHISLIISIFMILVIRVPLAALLIYVAKFSALTGVATATVISLFVGTGLLVLYVVTGKWMPKSVAQEQKTGETGSAKEAGDSKEVGGSLNLT